MYFNPLVADLQGSDEDNVLASSSAVLLKEGQEESLKLPPKSLTKSMDAFDAGGPEVPKRSNSMRTRSPSAFYQTM